VTYLAGLTQTVQMDATTEARQVPASGPGERGPCRDPRQREQRRVIADLDRVRHRDRRGRERCRIPTTSIAGAFLHVHAVLVSMAAPCVRNAAIAP
jgi:hypothetical protein